MRAAKFSHLLDWWGQGGQRLHAQLFGADVRDGGILELDGKELDIQNPRDAINAGICLLTEDRKEQGLILGLSVKENFGLPNLGAFSTNGLIARNEELSRFDHYVESISIKISEPDQSAEKLSGGNQQKGFGQMAGEKCGNPDLR